MAIDPEVLERARARAAHARRSRTRQQTALRRDLTAVHEPDGRLSFSIELTVRLTLTGEPTQDARTVDEAQRAVRVRLLEFEPVMDECRAALAAPAKAG